MDAGGRTHRMCVWGGDPHRIPSSHTGVGQEVQDVEENPLSEVHVDPTGKHFMHLLKRVHTQKDKEAMNRNRWFTTGETHVSNKE